MKIITSLLILFSFHFVFAENCQENRASIDIGSGTTKGLVAEVDVCQKKIVKVLFENRLPLAFNEAMEKTGKQIIPADMTRSAIPQMQNMLGKMNEFHPTKIKAVATSVFRVAKNGQEVAQEISKSLKIPVIVITQNQEAELGYLSAISQANPAKDKKLIVWDIGGGSMQMYSQTGKKAEIYKGDLASVTFKNQVLQTLQFKDPKNNPSPNPLGANKDAAVQLAKNHAYTKVPTYFKINAPKAYWIGVGGVLSESVQNQVNKEAKHFSQDDLTNTLAEKAKFTDQQLQGDYKITDVTNLALVLGYMKALDIKEVETVKASLGQGLLYKDLH
ncbi:Ppx/GppA phosphatase family protein [Bdellovibrio sp. NC01]|uniref:Ppx/GppA phosphatase family protein n=1 Tax=Bdellovibrio sp. NC01 TaxID=2220073 RepID=UPI00115A66F0|nr:hypothetical protein [Bdellovibrio sp. NC01]QDK36345.1 hypothetical protein DOE51_01380 [Bdellovibrio sp. NC01]